MARSRLNAKPIAPPDLWRFIKISDCHLSLETFAQKVGLRNPQSAAQIVNQRAKLGRTGRFIFVNPEPTRYSSERSTLMLNAIGNKRNASR